MKPPVSHGAILGAIMKKDLRLYGRNKLYLFLTVLSLALFVLVFWIMPDTIDESIPLAVSPPLKSVIAEGKEALLALGVPEEKLKVLDQWDLEEEEEGITLVELESEAQLRRVVAGELEVYRAADGSLILRDPEAGGKKPPHATRVNPGIGIAFPDNFVVNAATGRKTTVTVFADTAVPDEIRGAMESFVREIAYQVAGRDLPVEFPEEDEIILGRDRAGEQASMRDRLRPSLAFMILFVETFAMASLISIEVMQRTVTALVVTPVRIRHFLAAKTVFGTAMALGQGLLILALVGAFTPGNWSLLLATMLIGSILFTAVAMLAGSAGKDFFGQLMYTMLFTIPLIIPTFAVLFPGTAALWVRALPSYPIIDLLVGATIYGTGWAESLGALGYALLWVVLLYGAGLFVLKRKVESL